MLRVVVPLVTSVVRRMWALLIVVRVFVRWRVLGTYLANGWSSFVSSIARCKALDPRYAVHNRPAR